MRSNRGLAFNSRLYGGFPMTTSLRSSNNRLLERKSEPVKESAQRIFARMILRVSAAVDGSGATRSKSRDRSDVTAAESTSTPNRCRRRIFRRVADEVCEHLGDNKVPRPGEIFLWRHGRAFAPSL